MLIFNWRGLGILVLGFAVAIAFTKMGMEDVRLNNLILGVVCVVADVGMRARLRDQPGWLYLGGFGGALFFIPVWVWGLFWVMLMAFRFYSET
jgi:hypothetical protein